MTDNISIIKSRNNYDICKINGLGSNKVIMSAYKLKIPFDIELYNSKYIINFELTDKNNNKDILNLYESIKQIENYFANFEKNADNKNLIHTNLLNEIKNKQFISCIKPRPGKFDSLLRVHLRSKGKTIINEFNKNENGKIVKIMPHEIKDMMADIEIEIGSLWISKMSYGLTLYLNKCTTWNNVKGAE